MASNFRLYEELLTLSQELASNAIVLLELEEELFSILDKKVNVSNQLRVLNLVGQNVRKNVDRILSVCVEILKNESV